MYFINTDHNKITIFAKKNNKKTYKNARQMNYTTCGSFRVNKHNYF